MQNLYKSVSKTQRSDNNTKEHLNISLIELT